MSAAPEAVSAFASASSWLFVPATRPDRIARARDSGAHAVIVDLEDAVAPRDKSAARAQLASALSGDERIALRINAAGTPWFDDDLAFAAGQPGIAGIVVSKSESVDVLRDIAVRAPRLALLPLIETARGMAVADTLAAQAGVVRLLFGSIDFRLDLDLGDEDESLLYFRSRLVLASRCAGRAAPVDGVTVVINDEATLQADTARARRLGFGGKLCIHPRQVSVVNSGFQPNPEDVAWAQRVVALGAESEGVAVIDERMVDRPVVEQARRVLARHEAMKDMVEGERAGE